MKNVTAHLRKLLMFFSGMGRRKLIGLLAGPTLLVVLSACPLGLPMKQQRLLGVIAMTVTYWIFRPIPIPITSVLALAAMVVANIASGSRVFSAFSSPVLFLLIGGFILTRAMGKYGLGHRIALRVLSLPIVAGSTHGIVIAFGALATTLAAVIDNGALTSMLLPIALGLVEALEGPIRERSKRPRDGKPLRFATALLLMTAFGATIGAILTPFGDSAALVSWQFIHERYPSLQVATWMAVSVPTVAVLFVLLALVVLVVNRPEVARLPEARRVIEAQRRALGPMSTGETNTAIAFGVAVSLWLLPPLVGLVAGGTSAIHLFLVDRLQPAVVALLAASLLFVLPKGPAGQRTMRWRDTKRMDWGPVLLVGSAVALGKMMGHTGLAKALAELLAQAMKGHGSEAIYLLCAATALTLSELSTNLVSISVLVPLIPTLTAASGASPIVAVFITAFAATYGFMLPISTKANAIAYASGQVPFHRMARTGFIVDLTGIIVIVSGVSTVLHLIGIH